MAGEVEIGSVSSQVLERCEDIEARSGRHGGTVRQGTASGVNTGDPYIRWP